MTNTWGQAIEDRMFKMEHRINKFKWKYPELEKAMDWKFALNYQQGLRIGSVEEKIFSIFEFLDDYSVWRSKLDITYDHQKSESIDDRVKTLQNMLAWLDQLHDKDSAKLKADVIKETSTLVELGNVNKSIDVQSLIMQETIKVTPVIYWNTSDKARFLSLIFPDKEPIELDKEYKDILQVKNPKALYNEIKKYRKGDIGESKKINKDVGIISMSEFIKQSR